MYSCDMDPATLAQWRRDHGLTQQQLADRLGLNRVTIADWERGKDSKILRSKVLDLALAELARRLTAERNDDTPEN